MTNVESIKVSVVMPIYNAYGFLRPALDSVLSQTLREIEVICIDDGSTDKSLEIIKEYQKADARVRIITENNAGPAIARNKGLLRARGEYVIFLDADDFYEPTLLEELYSLSVKESLDIAIAKYDIYNNKKGTYEDNVKVVHGEIFERGAVVSKNEFPDQILLSTTGNVWNKLFNREFLVKKELSFHPDLRVFEDVYFVMSALSLAARIGKVQSILIHHRVYSEQARNKLFRKYHKQFPLIYTSLKEFMMHNGVYAPLSQSFLNLSANRCYKIYNLLGRDARAHLWDSLHDEYAESLGWSSFDPAEVEDDRVREFVANVLMFKHKVYLRRKKRGARVNVDAVPKVKKSQRNFKSFFGFIRDLFKKEKE